MTTARARSIISAALISTLVVSVGASRIAVSDDVGAPAAAGEPSQVVDALHEQLIGVMKDADSLGYEGRHEQRTAEMGVARFADAGRLVDGRARLELAGVESGMSDPLPGRHVRG